jgi:hypothetical protein
MLAGAVIAACDVQVKGGHFDKDRASALSRVQEFRRLYVDQNFSAIYALGAPAMKSAVTQEQFTATAQQSEAQFGKYKSSTLVASSCFPNEVRLIYHTQFEKQEATEMMVWAVPDNAALLLMYKISPGHAPFDKASQVGCPS